MTLYLRKVNFRTKGAVIQKTTNLGWKSGRGRKNVQSDTKKWRSSWEKAISVREEPYSKKLRIQAEIVGVVEKMSKVTLKSDALAEKRQFPYERRRIPKNYVFRLKK